MIVTERGLGDTVVTSPRGSAPYHRGDGSAGQHPREVLAIGPGRVDDNGNRVPLDVSVGDVVIYSKYGGTEVKYSGEEYLVLSARDVLAIVEK